MTKREEEAGGIGRLAFLHELSDDVVDRGNVVGVEGVPEAENICQQSGAKQRRTVGEGDPRPKPGCGVSAD